MPRIVLSALEQSLQHGQARLGPREPVARLVAPTRTNREFPHRHLATEGEHLELALEPGLVPGMHDRAPHHLTHAEDREPRLGACRAAATLRLAARRGPTEQLLREPQLGESPPRMPPVPRHAHPS